MMDPVFKSIRLNFLFFVGLVLMASCATKQHVVSYESPEATFETWRVAAESLDLATLLEAYSSSARPSIEADLKRTTQEELQLMSEETKKTDFKIERVVFEDNTAYLRVRRALKRSVDIEVLTMVKEGREWKLLP